MLNPLYREPLPPQDRPLGKQELFYQQSFKLQCFIFLKYREKRPKRWIMKFLFMASKETYYKYSHQAKNLIKIAYQTKKS